MRIGIFETEHFEGAFPVIKLFAVPANRLVIFTNEHTYPCFADLFKEDVNRFEWVILPAAKSRLDFFRQLYKKAKKHKLDLFYFNTISSNHLLFAWVIRLLRIPRVIMTVHDINCLFNTKAALGVRAQVQHMGKKALIKYVSEFNVVSDTMVAYLREKTNGRNQIHNIPGAVFEQEQVQLPLTNRIHLVVPGTLDKKRRDYSQVFALLQEAELQQLSLQVTLLGGYNDAYGKSIIQQAAAFKGNYTKVVYYDTRLVQQDEFDRQLNDAHFIFVPSVINTAICGSIPETYGLTKSSGNVFDVIKHARPFIVPAALRIPATLDSSCFKYTSGTHLVQFLQQQLAQPDQYALWQQRALTNSKEYTIVKVREKNPGLFDAG